MTGLTYLDKNRRPLDLMEWAALLEQDDYRRVALNVVGTVEVSTVWIGIPGAFGEAIFETMVFDGPDRDIIDMERYRTLVEAEAGHHRWVEIMKASAEPLQVSHIDPDGTVADTVGLLFPTRRQP